MFWYARACRFAMAPVPMMPTRNVGLTCFPSDLQQCVYARTRGPRMAGIILTGDRWLGDEFHTRRLSAREQDVAPALSHVRGAPAHHRLPLPSASPRRGR